MSLMLRIFKRLIFFVLIVFIFPAVVSLIIWQADTNRPANWHSADWNTAELLPKAREHKDAVVHVMAARTGRWKGAFSVHSWLVTKRQGEDRYNRYDKVGWGNPVRLNAYAPDAKWYSNHPVIVRTFKGKQASELIPKIEAAVASYPHSHRSGYKVWPGPNSNSFVAHVLNEVSEMGMVLPANAVGRDFLGGNQFIRIDPDWGNIQVTANGLAGFALGRRSGIEVQFLGLVAGFDIAKPGLKVPGFGTLSL